MEWIKKNWGVLVTILVLAASIFGYIAKETENPTDDKIAAGASAGAIYLQQNTVGPNGEFVLPTYTPPAKQ